MIRNNTDSQSYYDVLKVSPTASIDDIKFAYREAAKANHPDLGGDPALMLHINEAYAILKDDKLRTDYDMHLRDQNTHIDDALEESEPFAESVTEQQHDAFFARIQQVRFAVQNEYEFLRSATLRSLAIHLTILTTSIIAIGFLLPSQTWLYQDITLATAWLLLPIATGLFSTYVLLTQTVVLLVRPFQYIYECTMVDEHISYGDKDLIGEILADMIDTRRKMRVESIRSLIPKAFATLKRLLRNHRA